MVSFLGSVYRVAHVKMPLSSVVYLLEKEKKRHYLYWSMFFLSLFGVSGVSIGASKTRLGNQDVSNDE
jgi:hypothetical protein